VIIFVRALKLLEIISEIENVRLIGETFKNMLGPVSNMLAVILLLMYIYAFLGMRMFGGLLMIDSPE
jgi:hypothetical protein